MKNVLNLPKPVKISKQLCEIATTLSGSRNDRPGFFGSLRLHPFGWGFFFYSEAMMTITYGDDKRAAIVNFADAGVGNAP